MSFFAIRINYSSLKTMMQALWLIQPQLQQTTQYILWVIYMFEEIKGICVHILTLKAPITTAADDKFCNIFPNFRKNKV